MSKETYQSQQPGSAEERLPRKWNQQLLPGYEVVAVDERDPQYPDMVVINSEEIPTYPRSEQLLRDPDYVRFQRYRLEALFNESSDGSTHVIQTRSRFVDWLQHSIDAMAESVIVGEQDCEYGLKLLVAIQDDYHSRPHANQLT